MAQFISDYGKEGSAEADGRLDAPTFHRNHTPIWSVLSTYLGEATGDALEIGSGTGQHSAAFAAKSPRITWWPSDHLESHLQSIDAWRQHAACPNMQAARRIDLLDPAWPDGLGAYRFVAIVCINVLHIAPFSVSENLIAGAARLLRQDGRLVIYGPFMRDGSHTAPSNAAFDASLRDSNPEWGVRDSAALGTLAERSGLTLAALVDMPANNLTLMFERLR